MLLGLSKNPVSDSDSIGIDPKCFGHITLLSQNNFLNSGTYPKVTFSVTKATLNSQMSVCLFVCQSVCKTLQQLEIIILHSSSIIILHSSFIHPSLFFILPSFCNKLSSLGHIPYPIKYAKNWLYNSERIFMVRGSDFNEIAPTNPLTEIKLSIFSCGSNLTTTNVCQLVCPSVR